MDVLVTYDISQTDRKGRRRLRRIAQVCEAYGQRVQFSVFECRLSRSRLVRMIGELQDEMDQQQDSVKIYSFPGRIEDSKQSFGRDDEHLLGHPWLL